MKSVMKRICLITAGLFLAVAAPLGLELQAETYISPELVEVDTPTYHPEPGQFVPPRGEYVYDVTWQGIPAATVWATVEQDGHNYRIATRVKTASGIDIFYKLRYRAEGVISAIDLTPVRTFVEHRENSRDRTIDINFLNNGEIFTIRNDRKKGEVKTVTFNPDNFTLDPFSAGFLARSLHWEKGQSRRFDAFNGKSRYLITLTAEDLIQMRVNDEVRNVWVISPEVKNLSSPESNGKLRKASIYMTADQSRDILKIVSSVFIGSVTTELVSFTPSTQPVTGTSVAQSHRVRLYE